MLLRNKRSKFNAKITELDGIKFASKAEAKRWGELKLLERSKQITDLRRQVRIPLYVNGRLITTYVADFVYRERGREIVEDSKGFITPEFRIKAKLYEAVFGSEILITGKGANHDWTARNIKQREVA